MAAQEPALSASQRIEAHRTFYHIVLQFEADEYRVATIFHGLGYSRSRLIRLMFEHACTSVSQDAFLRAFFRFLEVPLGERVDLSGGPETERIRSAFNGFAEHLLDNFFIPLKVSAWTPPRPIPAFYAGVRRQLRGRRESPESRNRLLGLAGACLRRDGHRCVVTGVFDKDEARLRLLSTRTEARDDDGNLLFDDPLEFDTLVVAHVLPRILVKLGERPEDDPTRQTTFEILDMLDYGVRDLLQGVEGDRPHNALTLTRSMRVWFDNFAIFFEPDPEPQPQPEFEFEFEFEFDPAAHPHPWPVQPQHLPPPPPPPPLPLPPQQQTNKKQQNTYRISSFLHDSAWSRSVPLPVTRTLAPREGVDVEAPSPRLLAVHRAVGHILHGSGVAAYIDGVLDQLVEAQMVGARPDGTTDLARVLRLLLWLGAAGSARKVLM